jgi:hypothetical protein
MPMLYGEKVRGQTGAFALFGGSIKKRTIFIDSLSRARLPSSQMETALLVVLIFLIASGLNRIENKSFFGATIRNDAGERIETLEFEVPALRSSVLFYKAGELQSANPAISGRDFRLWYPPEEVSKKAFLESLENAIVVVGTHEASTSEHNKQIDGWPKKVFYDDVKKAAMVKGVVKGSPEANYVRQLKSSKNFGASGFIDARQIEIKPGTTPEGEQYDGIARDLFATHLALLPNVRDPKNKIETFNAVALITNAGTLTNGEDCPPQSNQQPESAGGKMADKDEKKPEDSIENTVRNVLQKMEAEKTGAARMDALEKDISSIKDALKNSGKNADGDTPPKKDDPPADTTNADEGDVLNK